MVGTLPNEFRSKNHWGLLLRSMLKVSYLKHYVEYSLLDSVRKLWLKMIVFSLSIRLSSLRMVYFYVWDKV